MNLKKLTKKVPFYRHYKVFFFIQLSNSRIGMTKKQLLRMLILEGLYYAGITILAVLVFGSLFSFTVVRVLSGGIWFMKYRFVIWPMLAACPFLILFGIVVPYLAYAPQRKNSLVEEIRKNE